MTLIEKLQLIERIDGLIRRKATGPPKELASRLNVSERTIYNIIDQMKIMGAPIKYCSSSSNYRYDSPVSFSFRFIPSENENKSIQGGRHNNFMRLQDFCSATMYF